MQTLKPGQLGWDVAMLQWRLGLFTTGYYDDRTRNAVKAFQKTHKLEVDGQVGPKTRKALDLKPADKSVPINLLKHR
jgi:peptidoglycan hydrolase-like protein with peptidoglycan-binding domain